MNAGLRVLVMIVVAALATGLSAAAILQVGDVFHLTDEVAKLGGGNISSADQQTLNAARTEVAHRNMAVWGGLAGAILGGFYALALGGLRRVGARLVIGIIVGIVLAGALGAVAGFQSVSLHETFKAKLSGTDAIPEFQVMLMHAATWGLIGLGVGLAGGLCTRRIGLQPVLTSMLVAGLLGALGGMAFPIVCGVAVPLANVSLPLPEPGTGRLIWLGLPSLLIGIGLGRVA